MFGRPGQPPSETTAQRLVVVVEVRAQGMQEVLGQRRDRLRALVEPLPGRRPEVRVDVELLVERTECLVPVQQVLQEQGGNRVRTARALQISRATLYRLLDRVEGEETPVETTTGSDRVTG